MKYDWSHWFHDLLAAAVFGCSTAVLNFVGIATLDEIGVNVPALNYKQGIVIVIVGTVVGMAGYLKQHPGPTEIPQNETKPTTP